MSVRYGAESADRGGPPAKYLRPSFGLIPRGITRVLPRPSAFGGLLNLAARLGDVVPVSL